MIGFWAIAWVVGGADPCGGAGQILASACVNVSGTDWVCSDSDNIRHSVNQDNAHMTTLPGFGGQAAITILGNGALSYRNDNASPLMNYVTGYALNIESNGDVGGRPGSVTIFTGGNIAGVRGGILTENRGTGGTDLSITSLDTVAGGTWGISAQNSGAGATA